MSVNVPPLFAPQPLAGKTALVTGGASGIGLGVARLFVEAGAKVFVADKRPGPEPAEDANNLTHLYCDVTSEDDLAATISTAAEGGRLDILVNVAGAPIPRATIRNFQVSDWDAAMAVHFRAHAIAIKHAAPIMARNGGGSIINTASIAGLQPGLGPLIYSATKSAVIYLTRLAALELAEDGIRVNSICPGFIATPSFARSRGLVAEQEVVDAIRRIGPSLQPLSCAGTPEDIAHSYLFLASDASRFVTGANLVADGGMTLSPKHAGASAGSIRDLLIGLGG